MPVEFPHAQLWGYNYPCASRGHHQRPAPLHYPKAVEPGGYINVLASNEEDVPDSAEASYKEDVPDSAEVSNEEDVLGSAEASNNGDVPDSAEASNEEDAPDSTEASNKEDVPGSTKAKSTLGDLTLPPELPGTYQRCPLH